MNYLMYQMRFGMSKTFLRIDTHKQHFLKVDRQITDRLAIGCEFS